MAEQERITIGKRQRQGIDAAKARGKHLGRPAYVKSDNWDEVIARWNNKEISAVKAMEELKLTKATFYKLVKEDKENG